MGVTISEASDSPDATTNSVVQCDFLGRAATTATPGSGGTVLTTSSVYDGLGRLVRASGAVLPVAFGYDAAGRMTSLSTQYRQDATVSRTKWIHDPRTGLAIAKEYDDETQMTFTHTPDGKPLRTTWARGTWRENDYDERELLAGTAYSEPRLNAFHSYDAFGYVVASSNAVARYAYANSALGVATNESVFVGAEGIDIPRTLDARQRLSRLEAGRSASAVFYAYDSENRLATVSNDVFTVSYQYASDGLDAGSTMVLTNGITLARTVVRDSFRRGLITLVPNTVNATAISAYDYEYDCLGRVTDRNDDAFGYNARSEVTAACVASKKYGYAYDNIGNHLFTTMNTVTNTYEVNVLNQYTNITHFAENIQSAHDLDGNLISNGFWTYSYDAENRMTAAYSNTVCVVSNAYDYMSRRVVKVTPTATHTYGYDGWNLVQETISTTSGVTTNHYVWGKDLSGTMQGAGGVGGLLAVKQGGTWYFPLSDANGNITAYVDDTGAVVAEYTYDAFGGTIAQSGPMAEAFLYRFSTKYFDTEIGIYYYGYRFYSPDLHRCLNRDPIEEQGGLNLYSFCGNDGVNRWDVLGMEWHVKRDGKPYAIAFSDNDGDTFDCLGIIVGLDTEDYQKWAHTTDASPVRCKEYQIPNVVVYHIGGSKYPWPLSYCDSLLLDSQRAEFQRSALGDESAGFYVMLQTDVSDAEIRFSLGNGLLYRYYYSGHGYDGIINTAGGGGVGSRTEGGVLTKYGINLLALMSCSSLGNLGEVAPHRSRYSAWEWIVAKCGTLYGYRGAPNFINSPFHWRYVGQGSTNRLKIVLT